MGKVNKMIAAVIGCILLCLIAAGVIKITLFNQVESVYYFDTAGGSEVASQRVAKNASPLRPKPDPVKEGYNFAGWYKDAACSEEFDFSQVATGLFGVKEYTVYARWTRGFTVTFDSMGGSEVPNQYVREGGYLVEPDATYSNNAYALEGWYLDREYKTKWNFDADRVAGEMTLYAKWTTNVTVTFDSVGGSSVPAQTVTKGQKITLPDEPTLSGYTFDGWYQDKEYTKPWSFDDKVEGKMTLYAKWKVKAKYTVTFNTMGGSSVASQKDILPDTKIEKPANPTRKGYEFLGWYSDVSRTKKWDFATDTVKMDMTLYAKWGADFTVTFDSMGGSKVSAIKNLDDDVKIKKPADPAKDGFTFAGWYKDKQYKKAWDFSKDTVTGNMTLYAKWTEMMAPTGYTVTFDSMGGSEVTAITDLAADSLISQPADPTREGFTFAGWYRDAELTTAWSFETDTVSGDITLYAKWTEGEATAGYTVTFLSDGTEVGQLSAGEGGSITLMAAPEKEGFTFLGWFDSETEGTLIGDAGAEYTPAQSISLYAHWSENTPAGE